MPELPLPAIADVLELLPPAGAALAIVLLGGWLGRRSFERSSAALWVVAIAAAYAWTFVRLRGAPSLPPAQSTERSFFAVLGAAVLAIFAAASSLAFARRAGLLIVAALAAVLATSGGSKALDSWPLALAGSLSIAFFLLLDQAALRHGPTFCLLVAVTAGALGEVFLMFGGALLGQLAGALSIAMLLAGIASLVFRFQVPVVASLPLAAIVTSLCVDAELFMYEPPPLHALLLLAAAPIAPLLVPAGLQARPRGVAIGTALGLASAGVGFFLAWRVAPEAW